MGDVVEKAREETLFRAADDDEDDHDYDYAGALSLWPLLFLGLYFGTYAMIW